MDPGPSPLRHSVEVGWRWVSGVAIYTAVVLYVVNVALPVALVAVGSFGQKWYGTLLPEGFTWRWYAEVWTQPMFLRAMRMSLLVATLAVAVTAALSIPAAYAVHVLESRRLRSVLETTLVLPIAIPPIVMGMGLIQAYNWPGFSLVGRWELLLAAHVVYTLPFMLKPVLANLDLLGWHTLSEAAESLGASPWFKTVRVLLPNLAPGILSGVLMTFAMSLGEFQLAVLLTGSLTQTYPVVLYQAFYVSTGFASAATTVLILVSMLSLSGVMVLQRVLGGTTTPVGSL
ncbi:MAG: ABC transporter permease subunit [Firmicutes bacterium]|nr:ABC transporter permease subunit [Bacillota bacterium]